MNNDITIHSLKQAIVCLQSSVYNLHVVDGMDEYIKNIMSMIKDIQIEIQELLSIEND